MLKEQGREEKKILQLIPATVPYWAVFAYKAGRIEISFSPVIGWQLVEKSRDGQILYRTIEPIIAVRYFACDPGDPIFEDSPFLGLSQDKNAEYWQQEAEKHYASIT